MRADEPAFPIDIPLIGTFRGLTKRERFVMAAMQGLLARPRVSFGNLGVVVDVAAEAIGMADATLAAMEQSHDR